MAALGSFLVLAAVVATVLAAVGSNTDLSLDGWRTAAAGVAVAASVLLAASFGIGGWVAARLGPAAEGMLTGLLVGVGGLVGVGALGGLGVGAGVSDGVLARLRAAGIPVTGNEWSGIGSVGGVLGLVAVVGGGVLGGYFGSRISPLDPEPWMVAARVDRPTARIAESPTLGPVVERDPLVSMVETEPLVEAWFGVPAAPRPSWVRDDLPPPPPRQPPAPARVLRPAPPPDEDEGPDPLTALAETEAMVDAWFGTEDAPTAEHEVWRPRGSEAPPAEVPDAARTPLPPMAGEDGPDSGIVWGTLLEDGTDITGIVWATPVEDDPDHGDAAAGGPAAVDLAELGALLAHEQTDDGGGAGGAVRAEGGGEAFHDGSRARHDVPADHPDGGDADLRPAHDLADDDGRSHVAADGDEPASVVSTGAAGALSDEVLDVAAGSSVDGALHHGGEDDQPPELGGTVATSSPAPVETQGAGSRHEPGPSGIDDRHREEPADGEPTPSSTDTRATVAGPHHEDARQDDDEPDGPTIPARADDLGATGDDHTDGEPTHGPVDVADATATPHDAQQDHDGPKGRVIPALGDDDPGATGDDHHDDERTIDDPTDGGPTQGPTDEDEIAVAGRGDRPWDDVWSGGGAVQTGTGDDRSGAEDGGSPDHAPDDAVGVEPTAPWHDGGRLDDDGTRSPADRESTAPSHPDGQSIQALAGGDEDRSGNNGPVDDRERGDDVDPGGVASLEHAGHDGDDLDDVGSSHPGADGGPGAPPSADGPYDLELDALDLEVGPPDVDRTEAGPEWGDGSEGPVAVVDVEEASEDEPEEPPVPVEPRSRGWLRRRGRGRRPPDAVHEEVQAAAEDEWADVPATLLHQGSGADEVGAEADDALDSFAPEPPDDGTDSGASGEPVTPEQVTADDATDHTVTDDDVTTENATADVTTGNATVDDEGDSAEHGDPIAAADHPTDADATADADQDAAADDEDDGRSRHDRRSLEAPDRDEVEPAPAGVVVAHRPFARSLPAHADGTGLFVVGLRGRAEDADGADRGAAVLTEDRPDAEDRRRRWWHRKA